MNLQQKQLFPIFITNEYNDFIWNKMENGYIIYNQFVTSMAIFLENFAAESVKCVTIIPDLLDLPLNVSPPET